MKTDLLAKLNWLAARHITREYRTHTINEDDAKQILSEIKTGSWKPIETVPKDGREILLLEGQIVGSANWCHWGPVDETEEEEGWTVRSDGNGWNNPTHWMPLPLPLEQAP